MITENDKRRDKFYEMDCIEFNNCIAFALRNGDRKVAYSKIKNGKHIGGMADTFEDALYWCKKFYEEDNDIDLCIGDFSKGECIWDTISILHEIGYVSDEDYDKYIDSIELDD